MFGRAVSLAVFLLLIPCVALSETVPSSIGDILVWGLVAGDGVNPVQAASISGLIANEVGRVTGRQVLTQARSKSANRSDSLAVARAVDASFLVTGDIGMVGDLWVINLRCRAISDIESGDRSAASSHKSLKDLVRTIASDVRKVTAGVVRVKGGEVAGDPVSRTRHRITVSPTAVGMKKGDWTATGYGLGLWEFQYGIHKNVQIGALTVVPIGLAGFAPMVSVHFQPTEHLALGMGAYFGVCGGFGEMLFLRGVFAVVYGGSVQMSALFGKHTLNFSFIAGSAAGRLSNGGYESGGNIGFPALDGAYMLPSIGYRFEVHRNWSLQFELAVPYYASRSYSMGVEGVTPLIFYGVRGHGGLVYGDIGFVIPVHRDYFETLWKYTPLGFPYFSLGFAF